MCQTAQVAPLISTASLAANVSDLPLCTSGNSSACGQRWQPGGIERTRSQRVDASRHHEIRLVETAYLPSGQRNLAVTPAQHQLRMMPGFLRQSADGVGKCHRRAIVGETKAPRNNPTLVARAPNRELPQDSLRIRSALASSRRRQGVQGRAASATMSQLKFLRSRRGCPTDNQLRRDCSVTTKSSHSPPNRCG
jgi:hypothetical protein